MKSVFLFFGLLAVAAAISSHRGHYEGETTPVNAEFVERQKKVFSLLHYVNQVDPEAEYYKVGKEYNIEANIAHYTNPKAVEEFLLQYRHGYLPKGLIFSVFYDKMREEAIYLYHLFRYAKDFDTFYKTAAWARVHLNEGLFTYSFSIAVIHREELSGIILPAPYELYPYFFVNSEVIEKMYRIKMQNGLVDPSVGHYYGITNEGKDYTIYANYSGYFAWTHGNEARLSYFTEDIELNTYYYYFHMQFPFWMKGEEFGAFKERRGEVYYFYHQQLLARYYMERLVNGLCKIPEFSWRWPIKTGYYPNMMYRTGTPFPQRSSYYLVENPETATDLEFVETYEAQFVSYLHSGKYNGYEHKVDLRDHKAINFVGNYFQTNPDSRDEDSYKYDTKYYEIIARVLLGGAPDAVDDYFAWPSAMEQFQTSLRDPAFWQLYKRIIYYFIEYKQYLEPYHKTDLAFTGVKINSVKVDKLVTYHDYFDFDATNGLYFSKEESTSIPYNVFVRQPRINHKPFNVEIAVKSELSTDAVFKIFMGPKFDGAGNLIKMEDNWMNFVELDWFTHKLNPGVNTIHRSSKDFFFYKEDSISIHDVMEMLKSQKVPTDMSKDYDSFPQRLMLPKGTYGGFPFQFFVYVYQFTPLVNELKDFSDLLIDNKPFGYPLDRPVDVTYFYQPNMHFEDVSIYHEGKYLSYQYNVPGHIVDLPKH